MKLAQEQLVHADISIIGNIHVHADDEKADRAAEIIGKTLGAICGKTVVSPVLESESVQ